MVREAGSDGALASAVLALLRASPAKTAELAAKVAPWLDAVRAAEPGPAGERVHAMAIDELLAKLAKAPKLDLERFAVEGDVGKGGMGAVYRIHDRHLNRRLAMKVLLDHGTPQDQGEQALAHQLLGRFLEEAQVSSQLDHPGVVPVHELGLDQAGKVWFTMRLVKGRTASAVFLDAHSQQDGWTLTRGLEVILKVCDTMAYAHEKGVLHRDLKPQNVMVGKFGEVYVMDWGLAKVTGQADRHDVRIRPEGLASCASKLETARQRDAEHDTGSSVVTMDGAKLGTPSYMPPEQARGEVATLDVRADVYAIGAMVYELVTGRAPYVVPGVRKPAYRILDDVADGPPKAIEELQKGVPAELVAIVKKAMARDREQRYADTAALAADLRAFLGSQVVQAYRTGALVELQLWVRRNKPLAASLLAAAMILVVGIVGMTWLANENAALATSESVAKKEATELAAIAKTELEKAELERDRAQLEEARAWVERARLAAASKDHYKAMLLAGRAVGYVGYGRPEQVDEASAQAVPELAGRAMPRFAKEVNEVRKDAAEVVLAADAAGTLAPIWSSPMAATGYEVAFSPDGARIASGSGDNTIRIWDATSGALIAKLEGHSDGFIHVAFSLDGARIASGSRDKTIRIWDATNGALLARLEGHSGAITSIAFSPDGARIASGSYDKTIRIWDAASGALRANLEGHSEPVTSIAFSSDGARIASGSYDKAIRIWDAASGALLVKLGHQEKVSTVAFSPDGARIASGSWDNTIRIWDATSGALLAKLEGHSESVLSVAFSPDGARVASGSGDKTIRIWDAASGALLATLEGHSDSVTCIAFNPDGKRIVSADNDCFIFVWDAASGALLSRPAGHLDCVTSIAFSPDGARIASGSMDNTIRIWDTTNGALLARIDGHSESVMSVAFSPDGARIASGSWDNTIRIWDATSGALIAKLEGHSESVLSVAFSPDGTRIASGSNDGTIRIWDTTNGALLTGLEGHSDSEAIMKAVSSIAFSPDGARIASGAEDKTLRIWDATSGALLAKLEGHSDGVTSIAFSPDGARIASGAEDKTLRIWDATSGALLSKLEGHSGYATSVAFSPDGARIASGAADKTLRMWDAISGALVTGLKAHSEIVNSIAFSPDGTRIATGADDGTIRIWGTTSVALPPDLGDWGSLAMGPDWARIVSWGGDDTVRVWDATSGVLLARIEGHAGTVNSVACSPDGTRIASGSDDEFVRVWDAHDGSLMARLKAGSYVSRVAFSPDGARIAGGNRAIHIWDAASGQLLANLAIPQAAKEGYVSSHLTHLAFSPDGVRIASGMQDWWSSSNDNDNTVCICHVMSGALLAKLEGHSDRITSIAFSPDGARIASGSWDKTIRVWSSTNAALLTRLEGHSDSVTGVAFSPDGARIASGSRDKTIRIWDAASGALLVKLGHQEIEASIAVTSIAFSPDGVRIASGSRERAIRIRESAPLHSDLYRNAIDGPVALRSRDLVPQEGNLYGRTFPMRPWRDDLYSRIAATTDPAHAAILRMQLCAAGKSWRAATTLWQQAQKARPQPPDAELRRIYVTLLLATARDLVDAGRTKDADAVLRAVADPLTALLCKHPFVRLPLQDLAMATVFPGTAPEAGEAARILLQRTAAWLPDSPILALAARAPDFADSAECRAFLREVCAAHPVGRGRLDRIPPDSTQRLAIASMALQSAGQASAAEHAYRRLLTKDDSPWARAETIAALPWSADEEAWLEQARQAATQRR